MIFGAPSGKTGKGRSKQSLRLDLTSDWIPAVLGKFASPALTGRIDTAHLLFLYGVNDDSLREFYEIPPYASGWVVEDEQCTQGPLNICRCVKCMSEAWRLFSKGLERDIKSTKHFQSLHV